MGRIGKNREAFSVASESGRATDATIQFYDSHAHDYFDRTVSADLSALYDRFLRNVKPGGIILDAGSGSGRDLKALHSRGFQVLGIDASKELARLASEYSGAECLPVRFENVAFRNKFDGIWACASLLHIPRQKIHMVLRRLYRSLHPGASLFASVRLGEGDAIADDGRFFAYYTCLEFRTFLEKAGFVIDDLWVSRDSLPGRDSIEWINVIAHRASATTSPKKRLKQNRSLDEFTVAIAK